MCWVFLFCYDAVSNFITQGDEETANLSLECIVLVFLRNYLSSQFLDGLGVSVCTSHSYISDMLVVFVCLLGFLLWVGGCI